VNFKDLFGYEGKNVVVTGAASGMAKAAAEFLIELGANVYALDLNEVTLPFKQSFRVNMGNKEEIDQVIEQLPSTIHALFSCHGVAAWPGKEVQVVTINYVSQRYLAERLLPRIEDKGSVNFIASDGAYGWQKSWNKISEILAQDSFESSVKWLQDNVEIVKAENSYTFAKKALVGYVKSKVWSPDYIHRKIRINSISPGHTQTGLTNDFAKAAEQTAEISGAKIDGLRMIESKYLSGWNGRPARPEEMGYPLVFLGSKMASYINGQDLNISFGKDAFLDVKALNANP
jgi:NAD(P)-dependent dehydrogenase (short-subunit alcohol dehydrogenase family)